MNKEVKQLLSYLDKDSKNKLKLAMALEYESTNPIDAWIRRNEIPKYKRKWIMETVKKLGEKK